VLVLPPVDEVLDPPSSQVNTKVGEPTINQKWCDGKLCPESRTENIARSQVPDPIHGSTIAVTSTE
jgi:hypothetical protein